MRHAIRTLSLAALAVALLVVGANGAPQVVSRINGIGLVDYDHKPTFKIGDWARYHVTGSSQMGYSDDYTVTVMVAGEEDFWGDPCFWIETWVDAAGQIPTATAACISYSIFADSLAIQRLQIYMRKQATALDEQGNLIEELNKVATSTFGMRREVKRPVRWSIDTLGVDTVQTPAGLFHARKVVIKQGTGGTAMMGDSSLYTEVRETRTVWYAPEVPITHIAREDVDTGMWRRTWMVGKSETAAKLSTMDQGVGVARLEAYGHGLAPRLVSPAKRFTIAEQRAAAKRAAVVPAKRATPGR